MKLDLKLHEGQREVMFSPKRYRTLVCGRRWGKSSLGLWSVLLASLQCPIDCSKELMPPVVLGIMPTMTQAKRVLWLPLVAICTTVLKDYVESVNRTDHRIKFKGGKFPDIVIAGANDNNGDGLRGLRVYFLLADEYQDIKPIVIEEVIQPAMSDTPGSRALFTGTPKGRLNHLYDTFMMASQFPDEYASFNFPTSQNPLIPRGEIDKKRMLLPPRVFRQEYEASFEDYPGKIYTELNSCHLVDQYGTLAVVVMGIDWGQVHPAISILGRDRLGTWYWLEGYSPGNARDSQPIPQAVFEANLIRLAKKWRVDMSLADPAQPSSILSVRQLGDKLGLRGLSNCVAAYNAIEEGINQVHSLIHQGKLLFVSNAHDKLLPDYIDGETAMQLHEAYHWLTDKSGQVLEGRPADGYFSHICDSTRYALATKWGKTEYK